jgi:hypothetical protein
VIIAFFKITLLTVHMYFMQHHIGYIHVYIDLPGPAVVWMILMNAIYSLLAIAIINYVSILQSPVISRPDSCGADSLSVACRLHNLWSPFKIQFYLVPLIVFLFWAHTFLYLGTICRFLWNDTNVSHWRFHDNHIISASAIVSKSKSSP